MTESNEKKNNQQGIQQTIPESPGVSQNPQPTVAAGSGVPQSLAQTIYAGRPVDADALHKAEDAVSKEWNIGDVILDLYEITGILGEGGMGRVYKVHHRGWNVDLAVKTPKSEIVATEEGKENFVREAETWVNLGLHPYTVSCYYVRSLGGIPRVFAEFVEGGSLSDWIRTGKLYEGGVEKALERILDIAIQFAWGLHYAHEQGLIHQDVKPANVMMTSDGMAKVMDFGLAKAVSAGGMTPAYCSPEQALKQPLTRKTDIWSWGVSVLEMFIGEVTWMSGQAAAKALESYSEREADDARLPKMPESVVELLRRCFNNNQEYRPNDLLEIADGLKEIYLQAIGNSYPRQFTKEAKAIADGLNNRAVSLLDLGRQNEAEQLWENALQIQPQHLQSTYNKGMIFWRSGRVVHGETLIKQIEEAQKSHNNWLGLYLIALVHLESGDSEASTKILGDVQKEGINQCDIQVVLNAANEQLSYPLRVLRTFEGHKDRVNSVCMSQDGHYALSGSNDHTLKLWEIETGRCLRTFEGHTSDVKTVCLSQDGRYALSLGELDEGSFKLWEVKTGCCLRTFEGHEKSVRSVCFSQDGRYALSGSDDKTLKLWEVETGRCLRTFEGHKSIVCSGCLSHDGRYALSGGGSWDCTMKLWEVETGHCLHTFKEHTEGWVESVCLSQDGRYALSMNKVMFMLWDLKESCCLHTFKMRDSNNSVCMSQDARFALSGDIVGMLALWELETGRCLRTFEGHKDRVNSVCMSQDGRYALSGSIDNTLKLWEVSCNSKYLAPLALCRIEKSEVVISDQMTYENELTQAREAFSQGKMVVAACHIQKARSQLKFSRKKEAVDQWAELYIHLPHKAFRNGWEKATFEGHKGYVESVCLSQDGRYALSGSRDTTLKLWEVETGRCLRTFEGHTESIYAVCLSQDGQYALSLGEYSLRLWELKTGRCLRTFRDSFRSVCLSQDGCFALEGAGQIIDLLEIKTGQRVRRFKGHTGLMGTRSVCLSQNGRFALSGGDDNEIKVWEVETGQCLRTFKGDWSRVNSISLSQDGRYALVGSETVWNWVKTLQLWEVEAGRCLRTFEEHEGDVNSVSISSDGRYALSSSGNRTQLWEIETGRCLRTFEGHKGRVSSVCLSQDCRYALSGSWDKTLKLWFLDWELEDRQPADWDDGAKPYLEIFLTQQTPYAGMLTNDRKPTEDEITLALTRRGRPVWNEEDYKRLLYTLGCAGYGWLRPEGVRRKLEEMAAKLLESQPVAEKGILSNLWNSLFGRKR